ncbi:hypothetical protein R3P38DRAFT_2777025 [Favolaschia claudopus]|uniref:Uncharacterized protein n=1 Tax=Favolaschia claudopus TaxID=2862362 RepID=A0AAW0BMV1_9AGAR
MPAPPPRTVEEKSSFGSVLKRQLNWATYDKHDAANKKYYFIVLDGLYAGIYTLESAARDALPLMGFFEIWRAHDILSAIRYWWKLCKHHHGSELQCDLKAIAQKKGHMPRQPSIDVDNIDGSEAEAEPPSRTVRLNKAWWPDPRFDTWEVEIPSPLPADAATEKRLGIDRAGYCLNLKTRDGSTPTRRSSRLARPSKQIKIKKRSSSPEFGPPANRFYLNVDKKCVHRKLCFVADFVPSDLALRKMGEDDELCYFNSVAELKSAVEGGGV